MKSLKEIGDLGSIRAAKVLSLCGDTAYDFALPLAIIAISPSNALIAGLFIIIRKSFYILLMPKMGRTMDKISCWRAIQLVLAAQTTLVITNIVIFSQFKGSLSPLLFHNSPHVLILLFLAALADSLRQLSEACSDISVKNFWVPKLFKGEQRTRINAQLKSMSLSTEIIMPMITATFFFSAAKSDHVPFGFYMVSFLNILSFIPEYFFFKKVADKNPSLKTVIAAKTSEPMFEFKKIIEIPIQKLKLYSQEPVFYSQLAVAFLGLTSLSPHSVLLRVYLLDYIKISNSMLALFTGIGAALGICGVYTYTLLKKKLGLIRATHCMVFIQALMVVSAAIYFNFSSHFSAFLFLTLISISRLGLYGFTLGSTEIEQTYIPDTRTGFVMGISTAIGQIAILTIFIIGTVFPEYSQFYISATCSALGLFLSLVFYTVWTQKIKSYEPHRKNLKINESKLLES